MPPGVGSVIPRNEFQAEQKLAVAPKLVVGPQVRTSRQALSSDGDRPYVDPVALHGPLQALGINTELAVPPRTRVDGVAVTVLQLRDRAALSRSLSCTRKPGHCGILALSGPRVQALSQLARSDTHRVRCGVPQARDCTSPCHSCWRACESCHWDSEWSAASVCPGVVIPSATGEEVLADSSQSRTWAAAAARADC
jgi:hypothetical protein